MPVAYSSDALSLCRNSTTLTSTESTGRLFDEPNPPRHPLETGGPLLLLSGNNPAGVVCLHSQVRIISACLRSGKQNQCRVMPGNLMRATNELPADAATLEGPVDGQI
jgi:hypothetical protein